MVGIFNLKVQYHIYLNIYILSIFLTWLIMLVIAMQFAGRVCNGASGDIFRAGNETNGRWHNARFPLEMKYNEKQKYKYN